MIDAISRAFTKTPTSPAEFDRLMNESHRKVYALALRLAGNPTDAEDLCQESYIRAYRFFHRYDAELSFTAWMYRILTNVHIDFRRRKGRVRTTSFDTTNQNGQTWDFADSTTSPDRVMMESTLEESMQLGLLSIGPDFRTAVVLADVEGLAYEEIAEIMQTSIGTVRSRIHRGRKQLRSYLEKHRKGVKS